MTTGQAGGMITPYKGIVADAPLRGDQITQNCCSVAKL